MQLPHLQLPAVLGGPKTHHDATKRTTIDEEESDAVVVSNITMAKASLDGAINETSSANEDSAPILAIIVDELSKDDAHAVASALHKLSNFSHREKTKNSVDNQKTMFQNGGHLAILQAIKRFIDVPKVQVFGLGSIMNLSSDRAGQQRTLIAQIGGIEAIVKSMNANLIDAAVQRRSCGALANLVQENEARGIRLDQVGGLKSIVTAMVTFPDDALVQFYALRTIHSILQWKECEAHLLAVQGASAAAAALENHGEDVEVSHMARKLFAHLATSRVIAKVNPATEAEPNKEQEPTGTKVQNEVETAQQPDTVKESERTENAEAKIVAAPTETLKTAQEPEAAREPESTEEAEPVDGAEPENESEVAKAEATNAESVEI